MITGPRGARLYLDSGSGLPLVWLQIAIRGGAAGDAIGLEGMSRHMVLLSRRGAGSRSRRAFDQALDDLGATLGVVTSRDAISLHGMCLARHLDRYVELVADVLASPAMSEEEHHKLIDETRADLDDLRDDDAALAARFFARHCVPGHPYARTVMGNEASLAQLDLDAARAARQQAVVPANLVLGFAGDVTEERARELAARIVDRLPDDAAPELPYVDGAKPAAERRLLLVDKPNRTQSQVLIGHPAPRYGSDAFRALMPVETAFGGTYTARLMQEIRVQRGWSYGAGCRLGRARGAHWFQIQLAPAAEVTADAVTLSMSLFETLVADGISAEELAFAQSYSTGNMAFRRATARQRMRMAIRDEVCGLPAGYTAQLPARLAEITLAQTREAITAWLHPERALTVVVASADSMSPRLEQLGLGEVQVVPFDSY